MKNLSADEQQAMINERIKRCSSNIAKKKLQSGEYVMHNGRIVPLSLLEQEKKQMEKTEYSKLRTKVLGIIEGLTLLDPKYFNVRRVITYAEQIHSNKRRDGNPEFSHQLEMLSLALGLHNSLLDPYSVYMAIVTHDLIEDYPEYQQELAQMFPDSVKYSRILSKFVDSDSSEGKTYYDYFEQIADCPVCSVVKLIDRIHNLSTAVGVFSIAKLGEYCDEVEKYFIDMMRTAKNQFNQREVYEVLKFMLQTEVRTIRAFLTILESKGS